jgi:hypothetical protein
MRFSKKLIVTRYQMSEEITNEVQRELKTRMGLRGDQRNGREPELLA